MPALRAAPGSRTCCLKPKVAFSSGRLPVTALKERKQGRPPTSRPALLWPARVLCPRLLGQLLSSWFACTECSTHHSLQCTTCSLIHGLMCCHATNAPAPFHSSTAAACSHSASEKWLAQAYLGSASWPSKSSTGQTRWSFCPMRHWMLCTACTHTGPCPANPLLQPSALSWAACEASARSLSPSTHATCAPQCLCFYWPPTGTWHGTTPKLGSVCGQH